MSMANKPMGARPIYQNLIKIIGARATYPLCETLITPIAKNVLSNPQPLSQVVPTGRGNLRSVTPPEAPTIHTFNHDCHPFAKRPCCRWLHGSTSRRVRLCTLARVKSRFRNCPSMCWTQRTWQGGSARFAPSRWPVRAECLFDIAKAHVPTQPPRSPALSSSCASCAFCARADPRLAAWYRSRRPAVIFPMPPAQNDRVPCRVS